ncbi:restriction endonuclease subunit S [Enterococcus faecium]|uniref:restriction endonuclease subunit S n=1 Tax=Enterococcus faecium TaxID=1352 RepID=UPI0028904AB4|nr:restriction endonuclease subunit S [Enterococcus faecium]MDT2343599.1 restriction endonuclease subunit S [Enterococcus faecium]
MSNDKQPEIRFPGFTEAWEQRKLGEIAQKVSVGIATSSSEYFTDKETGVPFVKNQNVKENWIDDSDLEFITHEFDEANRNKRLKTGDILTVRTGYPGLSAVVPSHLEGAQTFTTLITRLKQETALPEYVSAFINSDAGMKQITGMEAGGAQKNVNAGILQNLLIDLPSLAEQKAISDCTKLFDTTITLQQRKLDLLKETKKGFLQKMFPKNGAKVPEIRFPGFTEDWEQRKFGEIVQVSRGLTYKPSDVQIEGIRVLRSSNINEDVFVLRDDDVFVKPDAVNIAPIKNGDILITSANGSSRLVGKHAIVNGLQDKTVHGGFMLRVKSKNTWFTNSLMSSRWYNYFINIYVSGGNGAIGNLRKYDLESQTIIVPDDEEQQKIGAFFKQLDDTITLHQRKLDLLKETKKGFLQKMFV